MPRRRISYRILKFRDICEDKYSTTFEERREKDVTLKKIVEVEEELQ